MLLTKLSQLSLTFCVTKGVCVLPRALDGCTLTHTCAMHAETDQSSVKEEFWLYWHWNLAPSGLKLPCHWESPKEGKYFEILYYFTITCFQQEHYSVTGSIACESNLQAQLLAIQDTSHLLHFLNHKYYKFWRNSINKQVHTQIHQHTALFIQTAPCDDGLCGIFYCKLRTYCSNKCRENKMSLIKLGCP